MLANHMLYGLVHQYVLNFCNYLFLCDVRDLGIDFFFFFGKKIVFFFLMAESNGC
jgi:hypothetical protein